ncbi:unnamed protein product [Gadus morhua 'NCC']
MKTPTHPSARRRRPAQPRRAQARVPAAELRVEPARLRVGAPTPPDAKSKRLAAAGRRAVVAPARDAPAGCPCPEALPSSAARGSDSSAEVQCACRRGGARDVSRRCQPRPPHLYIT